MIFVLCIGTEIKKTKSKPLLIATWYRPQNFSIEFFKNFENNLHLLENENIDLVITGDFNCGFTFNKQICAY